MPDSYASVIPLPFVWVELPAGGLWPGIYVEADSLADFHAGSATAHWSTVEEAADLVGCPGVTFQGGPLVDIEVVHMGEDHWQVTVNDRPDTVTVFIEQDEAAARETARWLRRLHAGDEDCPSCREIAYVAPELQDAVTCPECGHVTDGRAS